MRRGSFVIFFLVFAVVPVLSDVKIFDETLKFGALNDLVRDYRVYLRDPYFRDSAGKLWVKSPVSIRMITDGDHRGKIAVTIAGVRTDYGFNYNKIDRTASWVIPEAKITPFVRYWADDTGGVISDDDASKGNASSFYGDNTGPSARESLPDSGYIEQPFGLNITAFALDLGSGVSLDISKTHLSLDGGPPQQSIVVPSGYHTVGIRMEDNVGNVTTTSRSYMVAPEAIIPSLTLVDQDLSGTIDNLKIGWNRPQGWWGTEISSYEIYVKKNEIEGFKFFASVPNLAPGYVQTVPLAASDRGLEISVKVLPLDQLQNGPTLAMVAPSSAYFAPMVAGSLVEARTLENLVDFESEVSLNVTPKQVRERFLAIRLKRIIDGVVVSQFNASTEAAFGIDGAVLDSTHWEVSPQTGFVHFKDAISGLSHSGNQALQYEVSAQQPRSTVFESAGKTEVRLLPNRVGTAALTLDLGGAQLLPATGTLYTNVATPTLQVATTDPDPDTWATTLTLGDATAITVNNTVVPPDDLSLPMTLKEGLSTVSFAWTEGPDSATHSATSFSIHYDATAPTGAGIVATRTSDQTELNASVGSSVDNVTVTLSGRDSGSGLASYDLWTVPGLLATVPSSLPATTVLTATVVNGQLPAAYSFDTSTYLTDQSKRDIDGVRTLVVRLVDKAGNATYTMRPILVKKQVPAAPSGLTKAWNGRKLTLSWVAVDGFTQSYQVSRGTVSSVVVGNTYTFDASDLALFPGNTKLSFEIKTLDQAGVYSLQGTTIDAYTPVVLGNLGTAVGGYSATDKNFVTIPYSGGSSGNFDLVREGDSPVSVALAADGSFVDKNLLPHSTLSYHLEGKNTDGDITTGDSFSFTVPNQSPSAATNLAPTDSEWRGAGQTLKWTASRDSDGDSLRYEVRLKKEGDTAYTTYSALDSSTTTFTLPTGLIDGSRYSWSVVSSDGYGTTPGTAVSQESTFLFDGRVPEMSWVTDLGNNKVVSGQQPLQFSSIDSGSGLARVEVTTYAKTATDWDSGTTASLPVAGSPWNLPWPSKSGIYKVVVSTSDIAGNSAFLSTETEVANGILVDRDAPTLTKDTVNVLTNGSYNSVSAAVVYYKALAAHDNPGTGAYSGAFSGLASVEVMWKSTAVGGVNGNWQTYVAPTSSSDTSVVTWGTPQKLVDVGPGDYKLSYRLTDRVGNQTVFDQAQVYRIDFTPAVTTLAVGGLTTSQGRSYLGDASSLTASVVSSDSESGVGSTQYALGVGESVPNWYATFASAKSSLTLSDGQSYRVWAKVTNGVGLATENKSELFIYDHSSPVNVVSNLDKTKLWPGDQLRIGFSAQDPESGIKEYRVQIGTLTTLGSISSLIPGSQNGILTVPGGQSSLTVTIPPSVVAGTGNSVRVAAVNGSGKEVNSTEADITIQSGDPPPISVDVAGPYDSVVNASFKTRPENIQSFHYQLYKDGVAVGSPVLLNNGVSSVVISSGLINSSQYQVEAWGKLPNGDETERQRSSPVTIDQNGPAWNSATAPQYWDGATIPLSWTLSTGLSGLRRVSLVIRESMEAPTRVVELPTSLTESGFLARIPNLNLVNGTTVLLALEAESGAGVVSRRSLAPSLLDTTAPPTPVVVDQGAFHNGKQTMTAQWIASQDDAESGAIYEWALTATPQDLSGASWNSETSYHKAASDFVKDMVGDKQGITWYFVVRATNGAGLSSLGYSDGISIDGTAPFISQVQVTSDMMGNQEVFFVGTGTQLYLRVIAADGETAVTEQEIQEGKLIGGVFVPDGLVAPVPINGSILALATPRSLPKPGESPLAYQLQATNAVGLSQKGVSGGLWFTSIRPTVSDLKLQLVGDQLMVNWKPSVGQSDTGEDGSPLQSATVSFIRNGSTHIPSITTRGSSLSQTLTAWPAGNYTVSVKVKNQALLESDTVTQAFWFDTTPPATPELVSLPSFVSSGLSFVATAADGESGIAEWSYRVGNESVPDALTQGWVSVFQASPLNVSKTFGAEVGDGSRLIIEARVRNKAGLWSGVAKSPTVLVDKSAPVIGAVNTPATMKVSTEVRLTSVHLEDLESGLKTYSLQVRNDLGAAVGAAVTGQLNGAKKADLSNVVLPLTGLVHGKGYTVAVQATSVSGVVSAERLSPVVKVDLQAPTLAFIKPVGAGVAPDGSWVVNSMPQTIDYTVAEDVSGVVTVTGTLTNTWGVVTAISTASSGPFPASLGQSISDEGYGIYILGLAATDSAGNTMATATTQRIRFNRSPEVNLTAALQTTPNSEVTLSASASDPEGDTLSWSWDFGDGTPGSILSAPTHRYLQKATSVEQSDYTATLTVTDQYGATRVEQMAVTVKNTDAGTLQGNETWHSRTVTGKVVVPPGVTLTMASSSMIRFKGNLVSGYDQGLVVQGTLIIQAGVQLSKATDQSQNWSGVEVTGVLSATGTSAAPVVIEYANRGVAASGGTTSLQFTKLRSNLTGLQVLGIASVTVQDSEFSDNAVYGLKEDSGGRPSLLRNRFLRNLRTYYQWDGGILTIAEVNSLKGKFASAQNSGNSGE